MTLLVLGAGFTGTRVALRARSRGEQVLVSARSKEQAIALATLGFEVIFAPVLDARVELQLNGTTDVVITYPPDGETDARVAPVLTKARSVTYVSSTAVYGELRGKIDDRTPVPPAVGRAERRLEAESLYRAIGGTVLRCPGIYGEARGVHVRLLRGEYRLPGDGSRILSRIHLEDLASFILAAPSARGETFVLGDLEPASHRDLVSWLCETYSLPFPSSVPLSEVHETLRVDRAIDGQRARRLLQVELRYPTYREGMAPSPPSSAPSGRHTAK